MQSSSDVKSTFECPSGFAQEDIVSSQLYYEDLDDDSELWLVRMPIDVDTSVIENQTIVMDGQTYSLSSDSEKKYDCVTEVCKMPNLCLVLPHKDSKELSCVNKTFKGSVFVTETMVQNGDGDIKMEACENGVEENGVENSLPEPVKSKKSKRNKHLSEADLSSFFDPQIEDEPEASIKQSTKSHKKNKSRDIEDFKAEPSSDLDSFPNCTSQRC